MSKVTKNIVNVLGLLTIAFAGYYLYVQNAANDLAGQDTSLDQMLSNTRIFIARSQELDSMSFDMAVLEDERFRSLRTFSDPVESQPIGRDNPFASTGGQ